MSEDACQTRRGDAAEILSGFRHIALNLLKNDKTFKGAIQRKTRCAMSCTDYLELILAGSPLSTAEVDGAWGQC